MDNIDIIEYCMLLKFLFPCVLKGFLVGVHPYLFASALKRSKSSN